MLYFRDFMKKVDSFGKFQNISANCNEYNFKFYSHNFDQIYSSEIKYQVMEKALRYNFKKVYVRINFGNSSIDNDKVNNLIYFELILKDYKKSVIITSCKSIMYLSNKTVTGYLTEFFQKYNIAYSQNTVEDDFKNINRLNFRKSMKIGKLESRGLNEKYDQENTHSMYDSDIINTIYNNDSNFQIRYYYMLFGTYFEHKTETFTFNKYHSIINNIKNTISSVNEKLTNQYKNEKKIITIFKNEKFMFLETIGVISNVSDALDILPSLKKLNEVNNNKEKLFEKFILLKHTLSEFDNIRKRDVYNEISEITCKESNNKISISNAKYDKHAYSSGGYYGNNKFLTFDFEKYKIHIILNSSIKTCFGDVKNTNMFFNLLEMALTDNVMDYIEFQSLTIN